MNTNIPFENVQFIFSKLIKDLYSLHKKNIAHGDIKPENILIKADGNKVEEVMFIDYGGSCMTKLCKAGGTILYASPEVLTKLPGGPITLDSYKKADVFSLGIVLFELLSNKLPSPRKASMPRSRSSSRRSSSVNSPQPSNLVTDLVPLVKFWTSDPFIFIPPRDYKNETWMEFMENLVEQMLEPNIQKRLSSRQVYHRFVKFDK
jgi:serine/threonine protein kinase